MEKSGSRDPGIKEIGIPGLSRDSWNIEKFKNDIFENVTIWSHLHSFSSNFGHRIEKWLELNVPEVWTHRFNVTNICGSKRLIFTGSAAPQFRILHFQACSAAKLNCPTNVLATVYHFMNSYKIRKKFYQNTTYKKFVYRIRWTQKKSMDRKVKNMHGFIAWMAWSNMVS